MYDFFIFYFFDGQTEQFIRIKKGAKETALTCIGGIQGWCLIYEFDR